MNKEELLKGLTEDQAAKVGACKNPEELLALAQAEGVELTNEQLAAVTGGGCGSSDKKDDEEKSAEETNSDNQNSKQPVVNPF